ncbi:putative transposase, Ptta/En/Spm, plant [Helianthus annuus]|uniref:Transposase, Ptta/En/Spm, plant n=1 Tax=Helianthus annuus TaxID=4232 RepID=A0A9K3HQR3_HELAN|nr:putative transposase, Ptta/En/Spm, plant [Helianthus annuus]KAJ0502028.1 putative transposase, Ptta/En/Spm, plant [Helianthus annuus]KAJ0509983.1 putative transposase, Ptta/En/Spm, plant [Helianthus annuus]KAJ0517952.1 putative transposase, Ptta/En/Spm, plant [Helianthus annuus]KAJ0685972.1 putative transposase, Ptta/En/Spm, plant [Helianthus annuus]
MSSLSGLAKLMHMKVINKWTDSSFDQLLEFLRVALALPKENKIPASHYEAKKKMSRYSSRKNKLHVHFRAVGGDKDVDRAKSCPPKNYDSRKWVDLIDILFTDPDYIRRSNANTENRKKQRYPSTYHGSQSYAQRRYIEQKTGSPNYIAVFEKTHYKEGRGWANDICAADWGKIQDELARASRDVDDTSPVDELEVLKSALGHRYGHVRGVGRVVKNVTHEISSSYPLPRQQLEEMQQMRQEIQEMRQQQVQVQPFSNQAIMELLQQQQQQQHAFQMQQMEAQFQCRLNELKRKMRQVDEDDEEDD